MGNDWNTTHCALSVVCRDERTHGHTDTQDKSKCTTTCRKQGTNPGQIQSSDFVFCFRLEVRNLLTVCPYPIPVNRNLISKIHEYKHRPMNGPMRKRGNIIHTSRAREPEPMSAPSVATALYASASLLMPSRKLLVSNRQETIVKPLTWGSVKSIQ